MANLSRRTRWKKWAPDLGDNRDLIDAWAKGGSKGPSPGLYLELAVDLTAEQLAAVSERLAGLRDGGWDSMDALRTATREAFLEALGGHVRVYGGPHTVDGQPLATLEDYLKLVQQAANLGAEHTGDLLAALYAFNSIGGADELFSRRSSGGARTTDAQRPAKADETTAAR